MPEHLIIPVVIVGLIAFLVVAGWVIEAQTAGMVDGIWKRKLHKFSGLRKRIYERSYNKNSQ